MIWIGLAIGAHLAAGFRMAVSKLPELTAYCGFIPSGDFADVGKRKAEFGIIFHGTKQVRGIAEQERPPGTVYACAIQRRELPKRVQQAPSILILYRGGLLVGAHQGLDLRTRAAPREPCHQSKMAFGGIDRRHEMPSDRNSHLEVWFRNLKLYLEAPP